MTTINTKQLNEMTDVIKKQVTIRDLESMKKMNEEELLQHTWIPPIRLDHIEIGDNFIRVMDRGNVLGNGELVDNSVIFTTEDFDHSSKDTVFWDI